MNTKKLILTFTLVLSFLVFTSPTTNALSANKQNEKKVVALNSYAEGKKLYNEKDNAKAVFNNNHQQLKVTDKDIYLMAQIVYGESRGEPYKGKVAVASVILNRARDSHFPKSIEGVIKQKGAFSCVQNGVINVVPTEECYSAVFEALKGNDPTNKALFFYNPKIATCGWMKNTKKSNEQSIGRHVFFIIN
ncbi:cell wall hydrolase [Hathewaya histolytica]|uniref:Spore cortex-lytic enzyme (SCLE) n=1 Tax=Hathewaya histolytica TaxID=1498 RepID=A0A4V6KBL6_HATHI|nr:cell wall hydrolase [Hathewaya histolytica]VTQ83107.1 spore cortex-lytic enzyme (SCLE) [Hathewaya histolytica]